MMKRLEINLLLAIFTTGIITGISFINLVSLASKKPIISKNKKILGIKQQTVNISANIGIQGKTKIFGYTSPLSQVILSSQKLYDQTTSSSSGYFEFSPRLFPENLSEICINSIDQIGRPTPLICIPVQGSLDNKKIGPILLPPTISLNKKFFLTNDEVLIAGQSIPSSEVNLQFFRKKSNLPEIFKSVFALERPYLITTNTDEKGNFSFSLKSSNIDRLKIFLFSEYSNMLSPQSFSLEINISTWLDLLIFYLKIWSRILEKYLLEIVFILEILIIFILLKKRSKNLSIILYQPLLPVLKRKS